MMVVFIPLLDLTIVPIRWTLAQQLVDDYARRLALCETFSEARQTMDASPSLNEKLERIGGIRIEGLDLQLQITNLTDTVDITRPRSVPAEWLPNGAKRACTYTLNVNAHALLSPAILFAGGADGGTKIPGLNAPIPITITGSHQWANLAVNPVSRKFYLNE